MAQIKLIWDFRGPDSKPMAEHHAKHLAQFSEQHGLPDTRTGVDAITEKHTTAWIAVNDTDMITVRDALRPHRGEKMEEVN